MLVMDSKQLVSPGTKISTAHKDRAVKMTRPVSDKQLRPVADKAIHKPADKGA